MGKADDDLTALRGVRIFFSDAEGSKTNYSLAELGCGKQILSLRWLDEAADCMCDSQTATAAFTYVLATNESNHS